MSRRKNKPLRNGRNPTTRFVRLDHSVLKSPAYRSLSLAARALLVELTMMENGENNGSLYLSVDDASARLGTSDPRVAMGAFDELEARGFIAMTKDALFAVKASHKSRARCWRLTWQATDGKAPTNDWRDDWEARQPVAGTKERKRMERGLKALKNYRRALDENRMPVEDSTTLEPLRVDSGGVAVEKTTTGLTENCASPASASVVESSYYTAVTMGTGADTGISSWANAGAPAAAGPPNSAADDGAGHGAVGMHRACEDCGSAFTIDRPDRAYPRRFCSETCRKRAKLRARSTSTVGGHASPPEPEGTPDDFFSQRLGTFWRSSDRTAKAALASHTGMTEAELSAAAERRGFIPPIKRAVILCELREVAA